MAVKKNEAASKADATVIENDTHGVADPAPAVGLEEASGAIIEPGVTDAVDVAHESVDANPREGTTAAQNAIDWNDPKRVRPDEADFTGQGVDPAVYGKATD
ncbi:hypothetical protein [Paracoccus yeei]|uniref:hypothetical protein n=1 Tax=Paracoccus yeei TaxID=147645 RepID=UPI001C8D7079|nr:hypothetical protein [Paracoccus yeei]MBY0138499.1 hypothetical protein [Paracoccus yeei]